MKKIEIYCVYVLHSINLIFTALSGHISFLLFNLPLHRAVAVEKKLRVYERGEYIISKAKTVCTHK